VKFPDDNEPEIGADESGQAEVSGVAERKRRAKRLDPERCELLLLDADLTAEETLIDRLRERGFRLRELTRGRILRACLHMAAHRCGIETAFNAVLAEEELERDARRKRSTSPAEAPKAKPTRSRKPKG
jgi:hypothetical protein